MVKSPFIWLGSGRARRRGVARRGALLDRLARAGLPVPDGAILLDDLFRIYLREGVVERLGERIIAPDPIWLLEVLYRDVRFPRLRTTADFSFIPAADDDHPLPDRALVAAVDLEDARALAAALCQVWSYPAGEDTRRDVLLTRTVTAQLSGRAQTSAGGGDDRIMISGGDQPPTFTLPRLGRWQRPAADSAPHARRLQMLLRGLRRTLGDDEAWDFYWADDGEICWVTRFN